MLSRDDLKKKEEKWTKPKVEKSEKRVIDIYSYMYTCE